MQTLPRPSVSLDALSVPRCSLSFCLEEGLSGWVGFCNLGTSNQLEIGIGE